MNYRSVKKLIFGLKNSSGRNNLGRISSFHRGGGRKSKYTLLNYKAFKHNFKLLDFFKINRHNGLFRLAYNSKGEIFYVPSVQNGQTKIDRLENLRKGEFVSNIMLPNSPKTQYIKSPGSFGILLNYSSDFFCLVKMPSGKYKLFNKTSLAIAGKNSSKTVERKKLRKAGESRWLNWRPVVRGVAMNPVDHPHGGGEGKTSGGRPSVSPWARLTKSPKKKRKSLNEINI